MNILYLGSFPPQFLVEKSHNKIDSLYRTGQTLVKGLRNRDDVKVRVITSPDIVSFPKMGFYYPKITDSEGTTMVSSLNLPWIKQFWTIATMVIASVKHIRETEGKVTVIIPYMVFRHVMALHILKKLFPNKVFSCIIIPDIFFPKSNLKKLFNHLAEKYAKKMDCFILYTEKMSQYLGISNKPFVVIEGYSEVPATPVKLEQKDIEIVTYTGSLNKRYGILRLLKAIELVSSSNIEFHFYGAGDAVDNIKEMSAVDKRIIYHGKVSKAEALKALYKATILINPRNAKDGEYVEYSFPSKDIEYLSTGIPSILCKLPSMPVEYYGHFIDAEDGSPSKLCEAINRAFSMSIEERSAMGIEAYFFIKERMNTDKQIERILSLLNRYLYEKSSNN